MLRGDAAAVQAEGAEAAPEPAVEGEGGTSEAGEAPAVDDHEAQRE